MSSMSSLRKITEPGVVAKFCPTLKAEVSTCDGSAPFLSRSST